MTTEKLARAATNSPELHLESFEEFVGVGVEPKRPKSRDMVVAVYVSKPTSRLSKSFKASVPSSIEVAEGGRRVRIQTKFVNVGELSPG